MHFHRACQLPLSEKVFQKSEKVVHKNRRVVEKENPFLFSNANFYRENRKIKS